MAAAIATPALWRMSEMTDRERLQVTPDEMRPGWPVIKTEKLDLGDDSPPIRHVVVEPPISAMEIETRRLWLDGFRAAKAGTELTCCALSKAKHPTYPTASGHEFGLHYWWLRGCAACTRAAEAQGAPR